MYQSITYVYVIANFHMNDVNVKEPALCQLPEIFECADALAVHIISWVKLKFHFTVDMIYLRIC